MWYNSRVHTLSSDPLDEEKGVPSKSIESSSSTVGGSPARALVSRISYSTSPKSSPYKRDINNDLKRDSTTTTTTTTTASPSKAPLPSATNRTDPSSSYALSDISNRPAATPTTMSTNHSPPTNSSTSSLTLELAGENAPYYLGTKDITLADKYIKDDGCHRLVHELLGRGSDMGVVTMDLRGNDIRRYGAEALGELMRENSTIETLNLEWNFLGDSGGSGLEALTDALKTNRTLTSVWQTACIEESRVEVTLSRSTRQLRRYVADVYIAISHSSCSDSFL